MFAGMPSAHALETLSTSLFPPFAGNPAETAGGRPVGDLAALDVPPLRLRLERKFNVIARQRKGKSVAQSSLPQEKPPLLKRDDTYPAFVVADHIEGQANDVTEAEGAVELRKTGTLLFADKLTYWPLDDEVEASGKVRLLQDGGEIETPHLRLKLTEQIGFAEQADYHFVKEVPNRYYASQQQAVSVSTTNATTSGAPMMLNVPNSYGLPTVVDAPRLSEASGHAERIDFEGENQIRLSSASYSTCKPGQTDWYLDSAEMHLDYDREVGDSRNSTLWFKGVPLFYTPFATFPLSKQRQSGFLHPFFSTSTKTGLDLTAPFFWAMAPNYDVTFYPRQMAKRGTQLGADVQYIDYNYRGMARLEYMPNDQVLDKKRYAYRFEHQQILGRGFSGSVNWQGVSDDTYWVDMSSRLLQTSQTQLPRQVVLNYAPAPWLQGNLQVLRYQTLQPDTTSPISRPYFLEPQLNLFAYKPNLLKTDLSMIGQYTRFTHSDTVNRDRGDRLLFYPQLSLPIVNSAFQITPKIGLHMSSYSLDRATVNAGLPDRVTRALPTFTLDSTLFFERETGLLGKEFIQTLEPRLYYVNIPYRDQSQIPVFDTGLADFNFAQIFAENRYSGYDRIGDANQLTAAVTTRMLDANTGVERFKAMLGQRYYFKQQRVALPSETVRSDDFSNIVAAVNGLVAPKTYADVAWEYNYRNSTSERFSAGVRYQPELGKVLSASYRYTRDALTGLSTVDQVDIAGQWPISARWFGVGRYNYSLKDHQMLEAIAGLEYNADCWAVRGVVQRLEAIAGTPNTTFYLQLELNDFAGIGANPLSLLRRSIPGYGKTNELTSGSSLPFAQ